MSIGIGSSWDEDIPCMTYEDKQRYARNAVDRIVKDLQSRSGIKHEWNYIESEIQEEIKVKWTDLIVRSFP